MSDTNKKPGVMFFHDDLRLMGRAMTDAEEFRSVILALVELSETGKMTEFPPGSQSDAFYQNLVPKVLRDTEHYLARQASGRKAGRASAKARAEGKKEGEVGGNGR